MALKCRPPSLVNKGEQSFFFLHMTPHLDLLYIDISNNIKKGIKVNETGVLSEIIKQELREGNLSCTRQIVLT